MRARPDEGARTEPDGRDGRLRRVLGPLLDLVLGLAHARLVVLGELEVGPPLLGCLRLLLLVLVGRWVGSWGRHDGYTIVVMWEEVWESRRGWEIGCSVDDVGSVSHGSVGVGRVS